MFWIKHIVFQRATSALDGKRITVATLLDCNDKKNDELPMFYRHQHFIDNKRWLNWKFRHSGIEGKKVTGTAEIVNNTQ